MTYADAVALGKSRSDCSSDSIDALLHIVRDLRGVPGDIAELGSYKCGATIAMAAEDPEKRIYAFDLFGGLPYGDDQAAFRNFADADFEEIQSAVRPFSNIVLIRGLHETAVPKFAAENPTVTFSLVFMDSDFYEPHAVALSTFWPLLAERGIVVFHDWGFEGVRRAIQETIPPASIMARGPVDEAPNMGFLQKAPQWLIVFPKNSASEA